MNLEKLEKKSKSTKSVFVTGMLMGIFLSIMIFLVFYFYQQQKLADGPIEYDLNTDGKPEMIHFYLDGKLVKIQEDRNNDGKIDAWHFYKNERKSHSETDNNFDGKVDGWTIYKDQYNYHTKFDFDFNGWADATYYFEYGIKVKIDWHPNGAKVIEKQVIFKHGIKTKEFHDLDKDGKFDLNINYGPFGREQDRIAL